MIELTPKRNAELLLSVGRVLKIAGFVLAFAPVVVAIPGVLMLSIGRALFAEGEDRWNDLHGIPRRDRRDGAAF